MISRMIRARTGTMLLATLALALVLLPGRAAHADPRVAVHYFYEELEPYGFWVEVPIYGTVWYPRQRASDWQPYVHGRWVWTTDYGWYWDSDEDWGWATYHYGRWVYTTSYGWVWVPDDEWGPAWVEWRAGGGYVGWAPMPPEVAWRGGAFVYADVDMSSPRYRPSWVFVAEASFAKPDPWRYRASSERIELMLRTSARTTDYRVAGAHIVNRSVDVARVSAAAKVDIRPMPVVASATHINTRVRTGGRISIYRPRLAAHGGLKVETPPNLEPPPVRARVEADSDDDLPVFERWGNRGSVDIDVGVGIGRAGSPGASAGGGAGVGGGGIGIGGGGGLSIGR
jgi:hypothetical protein